LKEAGLTDNFKGKEILFFGHFGVKGANINQYTEYSDDVVEISTTNNKIYKSM
jgi:hypothetical protein